MKFAYSLIGKLSKGRKLRQLFNFAIFIGLISFFTQTNAMMLEVSHNNNNYIHTELAQIGVQSATQVYDADDVGPIVNGEMTYSTDDVQVMG